MINNLTIQPLQNWGFSFNKPLLISGPCSAESEEQVIETAQQLQHLSIDVLRAGIWKPRTRPGGFEGIGKAALPWLKKAGTLIGKPVAVEVANREHVFECLKAGIDILWIGARTTANPFSVQEIADTLTGVDIPVIVKNPTNPDLQLWLGAIERVNQAGITKIAAIHRGFSTYEESIYRNKPMWELPLELRRLLPELPIFCDPSHICGNRELLAIIAQKAMDLAFDGLMIESHIDPNNALSDAKQQITPYQLEQLLTGLVIRKSEPPVQINELDELRLLIDNMDNEIMEILAQRMDIAQQIGKLKRDNNITIFQSHRWSELVEDRTALASKLELSVAFVQEIFKAIHQESIRHQGIVMNNIIEKTDNKKEHGIN